MESLPIAITVIASIFIAISVAFLVANFIFVIIAATKVRVLYKSTAILSFITNTTVSILQIIILALFLADGLVADDTASRVLQSLYMIFEVIQYTVIYIFGVILCCISLQHTKFSFATNMPILKVLLILQIIVPIVTLCAIFPFGLVPFIAGVIVEESVGLNVAEPLHPSFIVMRVFDLIFLLQLIFLSIITLIAIILGLSRQKEVQKSLVVMAIMAFAYFAYAVARIVLLYSKIVIVDGLIPNGVIPYDDTKLPLISILSTAFFFGQRLLVFIFMLAITSAISPIINTHLYFNTRMY